MSSTSDQQIALASTAIGIDIGTTNCYVGVWKNNSVEVIANEQGNRATPAFVGYTAKERTVGEAAYNGQHLNNPNTLYHVKAIMGFDFSDPSLQKLIAESKFPFTVLEGPNNSVLLEVEYQGKSVQLTPVEVVSVLFRTMKQTASQYMGFPIDKAVVSVPPHYTDKQKQALLEAAKLAELNVLSLCDEPAAAAISYKLDEPVSATATAAPAQPTKHQHVVVVDIGGVSTNITVMGVQNGIMEILGFDQDIHLGGENIDAQMMTHFIKEFSRLNDGLDLSQSARALTRLRHACEKAKIVLSTAMSAPIEIDAIYEGADFFSSITRSKLESIILAMDFYKRVYAAIDRALHNAEVEKDEVDSIIVCGGCGKIPRLRDNVKNFFGGKSRLLSGPQSVDECVAFGCAIQASLLVTATPDQSVSDLNEVKLNQLSIGIENAAGELLVLIPKGTPLPVLKVINTSIPDAKQAAKGCVVNIYEGEILKQANKNHKLGTISVPSLQGTSMKLEITMDVNCNIDVQLTHSGKTRDTLHIPSTLTRLDDKSIHTLLDAGHAEHLQLIESNKILKEQVEVMEKRGEEIRDAVAKGLGDNVLSEAEGKIMNKAIDDITNWIESITVGPILHTKKEDIEKKQKGIEILFTPIKKKMEGAVAKVEEQKPVASKPAPAKPAPAPVMMDMGDLD